MNSLPERGDSEDAEALLERLQKKYWAIQGYILASCFCTFPEAKASISYIRRYKIAGSKFLGSDPPCPSVVLYAGKHFQRIVVLPGRALLGIVQANMESELPPSRIRPENCPIMEELQKYPETVRLEAEVRKAAQNLLNDKVRVRAYKEVLDRRNRKKKETVGARLGRTFDDMLKDGWTEDEIVRIFRESQVRSVSES